MVYKQYADYYDVVIIGNGIAGNSAATAIGQAVIEKLRVLIISEEDAPLYSPCVMGGYICEDINLDKMFLKTRTDYQNEGIDCALGVEINDVALINKKMVLNSNIVNFGKLIFATGSYPVLPPIQGSQKKGVFFLKTIYDAVKIKFNQARRAVVVGSGPVGIEVAVALKSKGMDVTIIEFLPRLLPKLLDTEAAQFLHNSLVEHGINILLNEKVKSINGNSHVTSVLTENNEVPCEIVVLATGMKPRVDLAKLCNIEIGRLGGIVVDKFLKTNYDDVYACGDCIESVGAFSRENELSLLWHNARKQGEIAGYNSIGFKKPYVGVTNIVAINAFGHFLGSIGYTASDLLSKNRRAEAVKITQSKANLWLIEENGLLV
ncbi:MAG: NAD(P)/FAD-dependent oxidoreductase [Bacillota bacterium]|nr:NAD(P)/FAD-dependent oxidoreductase [Bacillota bacterium]